MIDPHSNLFLLQILYNYVIIIRAMFILNDAPRINDEYIEH